MTFDGALTDMKTHGDGSRRFARDGQPNNLAFTGS